MRFERRDVLRVPRFQEAVAPFLDPSRKIGLIDLVGPGEQRTLWVNEFDRRVFVHDALGIIGQGIRIGPEIVIVLHGLILHDHHAAIADVFEQPVVVRGELRPGRIGAHPQQHHVVLLQIAAGDVLRVQELHVHAEIFERLRHRIARAHHVSHAQSLRNFHVHAGSAVGRRNVKIIGTQPWIACGDEAFAIFPPARFGDCRHGVRLSLQAIGDHLESDDLFLAGALQREGSRGGLGTPAFRQIEPHRAFRARLRFGVYLR